MVSDTLSAKAYAKINLFLHITGKRDDGYHTLQSLMTCIDLHDMLHFTPATHIDVSVEGAFSHAVPTDERNIVVKAAQLLKEYSKSPDLGVSIQIEKNIPHGGGLGGGSADAAVTLKTLNRLWNLDLNDTELSAIGLQLGADVPMCLNGDICLVSGIGEVVTSVDINLSGQPIVLVNCQQVLSTKDVFDSFSKSPKSPHYSKVLTDNVFSLSHIHNDLEAVAMHLCPEIKQTVEALKQQEGYRFARMSGSGATCFGMFDSPHHAQEAAKNIQHAFKHWWIKKSVIL